MLMLSSPCNHDLAITAPEAGALSALMREQKKVLHHTKDILFVEGDPADCVILLASGMICLSRVLPNGRRVIRRFLFPREMAGLAFVGEYAFTAECLTPAAVYKLSRSKLDSLRARSPALQSDLMLMLKHELAIEREHYLPLMHQAADARLARMLLMFARRSGADRRDRELVQLSMTRRDMADFLGLTVETVCRSFKRLKDIGLISASSPDRIRMENLNGLIALANGER